MFRAEANSAGTLSLRVLDPEPRLRLEVQRGSKLKCSSLALSFQPWVLGRLDFLQGFLSAAALFPSLGLLTQLPHSASWCPVAPPTGSTPLPPVAW